MANLTSPGALARAIEQAIQTHAEKMREEIIAEAVAKFEGDLRSLILKTAVRAQDYYRVEADGMDIRVVVQHKGGVG